MVACRKNTLVSTTFEWIANVRFTYHLIVTVEPLSPHAGGMGQHPVKIHAQNKYINLSSYRVG